jgi:DNA-binding NarL/FixJ family response regulator
VENSGPLPLKNIDEAVRSSRGVLAVSSHLGDTVAITETARRLGFPFTSATAADGVLDRCRATPPPLVVIDLTLAEAVPLVERLLELRVPVLGFYPHVDRALRERALRAGLERVVPRSAFFKRLPELLAAALAERLPEQSSGC